MTFNYNNGDFISFAEYADVTERDQRFFEANEGITALDVNDLLAQASQRILTKILLLLHQTNHQGLYL